MTLNSSLAGLPPNVFATSKKKGKVLMMKTNEAYEWDDMVDDAGKGSDVNGLVLLERRNKGNACAFERIVFHVIIDFVFAFLPKP